MKAVITALQEVYGLFVEDGSLAVAVLVWVAVAAFLLRFGSGEARAFLLFLGIAGLLLENVWRSASARKRAASSPTKSPGDVPPDSVS